MLPKQKLHETESRGVTPTALESDPALKELAERAKSLKLDIFLSAEELKLTERQRTALIKTLKLMESGGIRHDKVIDGKRFNMKEWINEGWGCGTICCIGGTASLLDGGPYDSADDMYPSIFHNKRGFTGTPALKRLFYEWGNRSPTAKRAGLQLRYYLKTGKCPIDWADKDTRYMKT